LSDPEKLRVFNLISPVGFVGALTLVLALNVYAILRLNVNKEDETVMSTVRLKIKLLNIAVIAVSFLLLVTLVGYAFLENVTYR